MHTRTPFHTRAPTHTHTHTLYMWTYLQHFQTCCLGDCALFGGVAKETTAAKQTLLAEIPFLKIHLPGLKLEERVGKSRLGLMFPIKTIFQRKKGLY